jgi:hypothetical protein
MSTMPTVLAEAHSIGLPEADFEPYDVFLTAPETADWWKAWTGNPTVDGAEFRVFGQDGTGGMAAFWLVREGLPLAEQPVVFIGSEGETGVVARNLADYLWVLAGGFGPYEAMAYPELVNTADAALTELAQEHAPAAKGAAADLIAAARAEFPDFEERVDAQSKDAG